MSQVQGTFLQSCSHPSCPSLPLQVLHRASDSRIGIRHPPISAISSGLKTKYFVAHKISLSNSLPYELYKNRKETSPEIQFVSEASCMVQPTVVGHSTCSLLIYKQQHVFRLLQRFTWNRAEQAIKSLISHVQSTYDIKNFRRHIS